MVIRRLTSADREVFLNFANRIVLNMPNDEWFVPLTQAGVSEAFSPFSMDYILGMFLGDELIATAGLFVDTSFFTDEELNADVDPRDSCELGQCMVEPRFRGAGLMVMLSTRLIDYARRTGTQTVFATAHPHDAASLHSLRHVGFRYLTTLDRRYYHCAMMRLDLR